MHVVLEVLLIALTFLIGQSRMVARGGKPCRHQLFANVLHIFSGGAINHPAVEGALPQQFHQGLEALFRAEHLKIQVRPVKARHRHLRIFQPKQAMNILPDPKRRRGRERAHRRPRGQGRHKVGNLQIVGAEILAPLADAVRLVHGDEGNFRLLGKAQKSCRIQPLRGHINDFIQPLARVFQGALHLPRR